MWYLRPAHRQQVAQVEPARHARLGMTGFCACAVGDFIFLPHRAAPILARLARPMDQQPLAPLAQPQEG
jgi:hypothetical protein